MPTKTSTGIVEIQTLSFPIEDIHARRKEQDQRRKEGWSQRGESHFIKEGRFFVVLDFFRFIAL